MYSPKIDESLIPTIYRLSKRFKIPMTRFVGESLQYVIEKLKEKGVADDCFTRDSGINQSAKGV